MPRLPHEPDGFHYHYMSATGVQFVLSPAGDAPEFHIYRNAVLGSMQAGLPASLKDHSVIHKLADLFSKVSAQAQLSEAFVEGSVSQDEYNHKQSAIDRSKTPNIRHWEMKSFLKTLFDTQLRPGAATLIKHANNLSSISQEQQHLLAARQGGDNTFVDYFVQYYKGNFIDRLGQKYDPPKVSLTLTDDEIANAETVLIEYLIDSFDHTPFYVNMDIPDSPHLPDGIMFYPGQSGAPPTGFSVRAKAGLPVPYLKIPVIPNPPPDPPIMPVPCGITTQNMWVLVDLANGAANEAGAVGGLVADTPGGISIGAGIFGKISIGDNQTLSLLAKTAASRLALRLTWYAAYYTLRHVEFNIPEP